jgi:hypothetical protein
MDYHPGRINCGLISQFRRWSVFPTEKTQLSFDVGGGASVRLSAGSWFGRCIARGRTRDNEQPLVLTQNLDTDSTVLETGLIILDERHEIVGRS